MFPTKITLKFIAFIGVVAFVQGEERSAAAVGGDELGFGQAIKDISKTLTPEQREKVKSIATNSLSTKQQVSDDLKKFFQGIGGDAETKFNDLLEQFKTVGEKVAEKIKEKESKMSDEGKALIKKAEDIHKNMNISFSDERKQLKDLFDSASPEMKAKIQEIFGKIQSLNGQSAIAEQIKN